MGVTICEKHGQAGFVEMCSHTSALVDRGLLPTGHRLTALGGLLVCGDCFELLGFSRFASLEDMPIEQRISADTSLWQAFEEAYNKIERRRSICAECLAAIEIEDARRKGLPDPFRVFERTLTSNESALIKDLEDQIKSAFPFKMSAVQSTDLAVWLIPGTYRRPLTLKIYYETEGAIQESVAALLCSLLQDVPSNQAKLEFWEVENWSSRPNATATATIATRGPETLLREIYLNCDR
jgi:hypothetical protein